MSIADNDTRLLLPLLGKVQRSRFRESRELRRDSFTGASALGYAFVIHERRLEGADVCNRCARLADAASSGSHKKVCSMQKVTAWTVLLLGTLLVIGGVPGLAEGVREGELAANLFRAVVLLVVVIGMVRARRQLRPRIS